MGGKSGRRYPALFALGVAAALLCGCGRYGGARTTLRTTVQGREVVAVARGGATIANSEAGDAAVIRFGGKEIRVEPDRVLADGVVRAELPAKVTRVELVLLGNMLLIKVDGRETFRGEL